MLSSVTPNSGKFSVLIAKKNLTAKLLLTAENYRKNATFPNIE